MRLYDRTGDPITCDAGYRIENWATDPTTAAIVANPFIARYYAVAPD
jgi:hypothetical protein